MYTIRPAHIHEISILTALTLRSKAYWGYDEEFMRRCTDDLTITAEKVPDTFVVDDRGFPVGVCEVRVFPDENRAEVINLFVAPDAMGHGIGRALWNHAVEIARTANVAYLDLVADPNAVSFYEHMGAVIIDEVASGCIEGRMLPFMRATL
jgi:GNAT superfamily N-acetyltransferase